MTRRNVHSGWRRLRDRVLLILAGILGAFVIGEIVVRVGGFGPNLHPVHAELFTLSDDPLLRYTLIPNADAGQVRINRHGFRGSVVSRRKPPRTFRILCVGDSICFGFGVGQDETFSARLEQCLNQCLASPQRRFEVLNFGVTGYNIVQVAQTMRQRSIEFEPDLILYAYCLNDPQDFSYEFDALYNHLNNAEMRFREYVIAPAHRLAVRSRLYALLRYAVEAATPEGWKLHGLAKDPQFRHLQNGSHVDYFTRLHREPPGKSRLEDELATMGRIARAHDTPVCLVLFPLLVESKGYPFLALHRQVSAIATAQQFSVIDLTSPFKIFEDDEFQSMYADPLHPTPDGHTVAAVAILRGLLARGLLPTSDKDAVCLTSAPEPFSTFARRLTDLAED